MFLFVIIILLIIAIIFTILFFLNLKNNKNKTIFSIIALVLNSIVFISAITFIFYDKKKFKNLIHDIINSSKITGWIENPELQLNTINKCKYFMKKKHKELSGDLYENERIKNLKDKALNQNVKQAKDDIYYTALSCLNAARIKI